MPVYNEGVNLKFMLKILNAGIETPHEVLIIYDHLNDNCIPIIQEMQKKYVHMKAIYNTTGRGISNAIRKGFSLAKGEYILIIAADDIGPVLAVDEMILLMDTGYDLVSATRYAHGGRVYGKPLLNKLLSKIANRLFYLLSFNSTLTDATIGIKMFRQSLKDQIKLESESLDWAIAFELAIKAHLMGYRLAEIPIISINRFYGGKSSFKLGLWLAVYGKWFMFGIYHIISSGAWKRKVNHQIPKNLTIQRE